MSLLAEIRSEAARILRRQVEPLSLDALSAGWQTSPRRRGAEYLKAFGQMPWLRATLQRAAMGFAAVEWRLFEGERELTSHPVLTALHRPNRRWPGFWLRWLADVHLWLRGEAFWLLEVNGVGQPAELLPVPPHWVREAPPLRDQPFRVRWYAEERVVPPERMIWFSEPDPADPFGRGLGVVESLADELDSDEYAARWNKLLFFNKGIPEILVSLRGWQAGQLREFRDEWMEKYAGYWNARKPGFVNTEIQVERLTESMEDMDFVNLRRFARDTIISVIGTPPETVGVLQASNRATIESAEFFLAKYLIEPRLRAFRDVLETQLLPLYPRGDRLRLVYDSPVPDDKAYNLDLADKGVRGQWLKVSDAQRLVGLEPDPTADVYLLSGLTIPTARLRGGSEPPDDESRAVARQGGRRTLDNLVERVLDPEGETDRMWQALRPRYIAVLERMGAKAVEDATSGQRGARRRDFEFSEAVEAFLRAVAGERIRGFILTTTLQRLRETLAEGIAARETTNQLVDRVGEVYVEAKGFRAEVIARTEVVRAASFATEEGYVQAGVPYKEWLATRDDRVRDSHLEADGQVVPVGANFTLGSGVQTPGPGQSGLVEEDIQCRCAIAPAASETSERTAEQRAALWRAADQVVLGLERLFRTATIKEFQAQQRRVVQRLRTLLAEEG